MYFSALKRLISSVEEKMFYDVAILFLEAQGYKGLSIVDGSGDGGRDVISSRSDLRIQLSVRKDWETKVNSEAALTKAAGKRHFVYITNRLISPESEADFTTNRYKFAGDVDVSIFDLNYIATTLAHSSLINRAYGTLGASTDFNLQPTPREVALSSLLLFGVEAEDLRDSVVEADVQATLFDNDGGISENDLTDQVSGSLPGANVSRLVTSAISRLRVQGSITGTGNKLTLSPADKQRLHNARSEFQQSLSNDVKSLIDIANLSRASCIELITIARNLLMRGRDLEGMGELEERLRSFLAKHR